MDQQNRTDAYLQIGEAADRAQLTQRTLRYYEEKGLLKPPDRMDGGFRLYSGDDMERLERIKELKELLGFSLAEIKDMLEADDEREQIKTGWRTDADVAEKIEKGRKARALTLQQLALIDTKMEKMASMRAVLMDRLEKYDAREKQWQEQLLSEPARTGVY